ncbi:hypothetical protein Tco_1466781 [Tanacetum coccineum]
MHIRNGTVLLLYKRTESQVDRLRATVQHQVPNQLEFQLFEVGEDPASLTGNIQESFGNMVTSSSPPAPPLFFLASSTCFAISFVVTCARKIGDANASSRHSAMTLGALPTESIRL